MMGLNYSSALCSISEERRLHIIGDASFGLAPHGQVQSHPFWCSLVCHFKFKFKLTSHFKVPNLRGKNLILHLSTYRISYAYIICFPLTLLATDT